MIRGRIEFDIVITNTQMAVHQGQSIDALFSSSNLFIFLKQGLDYKDMHVRVSSVSLMTALPPEVSHKGTSEEHPSVIPGCSIAPRTTVTSPNSVLRRQNNLKGQKWVK